MNLTEAGLERKDCPIHYWTGGKPDAPLVIFTHGATNDHMPHMPPTSINRKYSINICWSSYNHE